MIDPVVRRPGEEPGRSGRPEEVDLRTTLAHHFDLVVVIWALSLAIGFSVATLSKADLSVDQWSHAPQSGPVWVVPNVDSPR